MEGGKYFPDPMRTHNLHSPQGRNLQQPLNGITSTSLIKMACFIKRLLLEVVRIHMKPRLKHESFYTFRLHNVFQTNIYLYWNTSNIFLVFKSVVLISANQKLLVLQKKLISISYQSHTIHRQKWFKITYKLLYVSLSHSPIQMHFFI